MKEMDWADEWLNEIKSDVRHLRKMIKNTKRDKGDTSLKRTRERITKILAKEYDVNSPESVFRWLEDLAKHLMTTKILLKKAKTGLDENSRTAEAYRCTKNLLRKINGRLQNFCSNPKTKINQPEECLCNKTMR
jgi:hypothetical protein